MRLQNGVTSFQKANKAEFAQLIEAARPRKISRANNGDDREANSSEGNPGPTADNEVMVVEDSGERKVTGGR